ncbi:MAG: hypothetical protein JJT77_02980 [Crocinitomicaceae bacterium]|nr:hypothetical protein [Crocinitomicaceae bacterium]
MRHILFLLILFFTVTLLAQGGKERPHHFLERGFYFDLGLYQPVPTKNIIFQKWRSSDDNILKQTLSSEWPRTTPGAFAEINYNLGYYNPLFAGVFFSWQNAYRNKEDDVRILPINDQLNAPPIEWSYIRRMDLFNYGIQVKPTIVDNGNFYLHPKLRLGVAHYQIANNFRWKTPILDTTYTIRDQRFRAVTFLADLALETRWQFSEFAALTAAIGYQFQTPHRLFRKSYVDEWSASLENNNFYPIDADFVVNYPENTFRPLRLQHEQLYFQVGLSLRFTEKMMAEKPILYLYPEEEKEISVSIVSKEHQVVYSYPKYHNEWKVLAYPNGNLLDEITGKKYYALFWETEGPQLVKELKEGFIVTPENAATFLEEKLALLGLNDRERNEFIIYWLPKLEQHPYNAIYFAQEEYQKAVQLAIHPSPDVLIRVMMLWQPLDAPIILNLQKLPVTPQRNGFVAVEWGGAEGDFFRYQW